MCVHHWVWHLLKEKKGIVYISILYSLSYIHFTITFFLVICKKIIKILMVHSSAVRIWKTPWSTTYKMTQRLRAHLCRRIYAHKVGKSEKLSAADSLSHHFMWSHFHKEMYRKDSLIFHDFMEKHFIHVKIGIQSIYK